MKTSTAIDHLCRLAATKHPNGQYFLAKFLVHFRDHRTRAKAVKLFKSAAENGHMGALTCLGEMHEFGIGTKLNTDMAVKCYKAAAPTNRQACLNLGFLYQGGVMVRHNLTATKRWFAKAAKTPPPVVWPISTSISEQVAFEEAQKAKILKR